MKFSIRSVTELEEVTFWFLIIFFSIAQSLTYGASRVNLQFDASLAFSTALGLSRTSYPSHHIFVTLFGKDYFREGATESNNY